jgi:8-oxo-dGTP pyrophosphatase MutT (NUDIX family)
VLNLSKLEDPVAGVPPEVWRTGSFQRWYRAQRGAGNILQDAQLLWSLHVGDDTAEPFLWVMRVAVLVVAENRVKANEVVISRPDISAVALYRPAPSLDETLVVLIREFRSPASTPDGFVRELPSGSGSEPDARAQAVAELAEETGFVVSADRLRSHGSRQCAATLCAHHAHLFSAAITEDELDRLRARLGEAHGAGDGEERTWLEITTFGEIRRGRSVDWTTLGMLAQALLEDGERR